MTETRKLAVVLALVCLGGCATGDEEEPNVEATSQALTGTFSLSDGWWGTWGTGGTCAAGTFAVGYQIRVEPRQGSGDDTALNAISLLCANKSGGNQNVTGSSPEDGWGTYTSFNVCPTGWGISGGNLQLEGQQGSGDDTAANNLQMQCSNSPTSNSAATQTMSFSNAGWGNWGTYQGMKTCSWPEVVCGIQTRVERPQGSNVDDTALNGVRLTCCFP